MKISSTDAKNRFGQVLDEAQKRPVTIEKSGRRHSVLMSAELYDQLVARSAVPAGGDAAPPLNAQARAFCERYKDWVDEQNRHVERHGVWNEEFRTW